MRSRTFSALALSAVLAAFGFVAGPGVSSPTPALADDPVELVTEQQTGGGQFVYVVFHALDRDGFCSVPPGAVSLHPVLGIPVDFIIESGDGIIIETSSGPATPGRSALGVKTFSTAVNAASANPVKAFPPLIEGLKDECQAWVKISQSIPGPLNVLVFVDGPGGRLGFVADASRRSTTAMTLTFRWSLVTWSGPDASPGDALKGSGPATGGSDVSGHVTAVYGWNAPAQSWRAYFPSGAGVPGANDLAVMESGQPYWIAIRGTAPVEWLVPAH
jgi:hypothetical protein